MNKKFSTLLASVLLAGSVGAFAQTDVAPATFKTGDVLFLKNAGTGANSAHLQGTTYLKVTKDGGILPVFEPDFTTKANIDSLSWIVTVTENAGSKKDYSFVNVANKNLKLSFNAPTKSADVAADSWQNLHNTTDSAKVSTADRKWSIDSNASSNGYSLSYTFQGKDGLAVADSIVAIGVFRNGNATPTLDGVDGAYMVRIAKTELTAATNDGIKAAVKKIEDADTSCSDYTSWSFESTEDALKKLVNIKYSELNLPVIQSTNVPGLANFQVVPVTYDTNTGAWNKVENPTGDEIMFSFLPASQIGLENPEYFTIDTARYDIAGVHQDDVYAYGLDTDTIITDATAIGSLKNGLRVFSLMREVGREDSVIFRPASIVEYDGAATYKYAVKTNPGTGIVSQAPGTYSYTTGEAVLGTAKLEDTELVSTVFAQSSRKEGKLAPYAFEAPVYPEIAEGYYFFQSTNKATADKYIVNSLCGTATNNYREFVDEVSADNSYNVWVVEGEGKDMTIKNRYTGEDFSLILFEAGEGLYTTGKLDTFKIEAIEDIKKGGVDYYQIETPEYKKFALSLVNGIGENIYVTTVADSVLGVKVDDASLLLYPTVKETKKYGVNDELVAETYTFKTKDGKVLTRNAKGQLIIDEEEGAYPVIFAFKNAGNGEYFAVYNVLTGTMASQTAETVWYLNAQATDNYMQYVSGVGCPEGQDRFTLEAPAAPKYLTVAPGHYTIKTDGREDMLTMGADSAAIFRRITSDLKSDYNKESFALWIDTAKFDAGETPLNVPTYFIMKGAAYEEDTLAGNFLGAYRTYSVMFVEAKRVATKDTLVIASTEKALKNDAVKPYQFKFPFVDGEEGAVYVQNENNKYLRIINEYVTLTDKEEEAIAVNVVTTDTPTDNEEIATSEVTVIAQDGAVRIANAEGKKVVITNILGQTVANTVITSDNATIAAPQGVVVVAVEGEEAVKAIVK